MGLRYLQPNCIMQTVQLAAPPPLGWLQLHPLWAGCSSTGCTCCLAIDYKSTWCKCAIPSFSSHTMKILPWTVSSAQLYPFLIFSSLLFSPSSPAQSRYNNVLTISSQYLGYQRIIYHNVRHSASLCTRFRWISSSPLTLWSSVDRKTAMACAVLRHVDRDKYKQKRKYADNI